MEEGIDHGRRGRCRRSGSARSRAARIRSRAALPPARPAAAAAAAAAGGSPQPPSAAAIPA